MAQRGGLAICLANFVDGTKLLTTYSFVVMYLGLCRGILKCAFAFGKCLTMLKTYYQPGYDFWKTSERLDFHGGGCCPMDNLKEPQ